MWLIFLALILIPVLSYADCSQWILCPYRTNDDTPIARRVSIDDLRLTDVKWNEIEVAGNQALVCMSKMIDEGLLSRVNCTKIPQRNVENYLVPPDVPYFNTEKQQIEFHDGNEGREKRTRPFDEQGIRKRINDSTLSTGALKRR